jgi:uncharacterized membrane protein
MPNNAEPPLPDHRIVSLDVARGIIISLMALDHVRQFFTAAQFDPVDLNHTNIAYFLTRFVTHFCAPGFFFISGMSVALMERRMPSRAAVATRLLGRGAWLVLLELTVIGFAWSFAPGWSWLGVIWCLGASFALLGALIYVPRSVLLVGAIAFTCLHNAFWTYQPPDHGAAASLNAILYAGGPAVIPGFGEKFVLYPLLPWLSLMVLGYATGPWLFRDPARRRFRLLMVGATATAAFMVLRLTNLYGAPPLTTDASDSGGFVAIGSVAHDVMSALNVNKYPPSLQFSLLTVGGLLMVLAWLSRFDQKSQRRSPWLRPIATFGRVPFAFYVMHLFLIHGLALIVAQALGWPTATLFWKGPSGDATPPSGYGFGLPGVYAVWLVVLLILYPLCDRFAALKRRKPNNWVLQYL